MTPKILTGRRVTLQPLVIGEDSRPLYRAAGPSPRSMLQFMYTRPKDDSPEAFEAWLFTLVTCQRSVIWSIWAQPVTGSPRAAGMIALYESLHPGAMEIGGVWIGSAWRGTGIVVECLLLVNTFAFEECHAHRVQGGYHARNEATPRLLQKLGPYTRDGVLREFFVNDDGSRSDYVLGAMLDHEWPEKKKLFEQVLGTWNDDPYGRAWSGPPYVGP